MSVFSFVKDPNDPVKLVADVSQATKQVNKYINRVAQKVGIDKRITSYHARHSFATILKRSGVNVSYISEALGHTNIQTTES